MPNSINPNLNVFQAQSNANYQQFVGSLSIDPENKRIKDFAHAQRDKLHRETERISDGMGHNDKIVRHAEPIARFPEDEKNEQRIEDEGREMHERRIKGMDGDYIKDLEKDLANCRNTLASVEYSEGARLAEVRKRLHGAKELEGRTFEESTSIKSARDHYQKTLDRLKKAKIEELNEKNLPEDALRREMAELIKYFGFCEAIEKNNAEKNAKAESNMGGNVVQKCWGMLEKTSNWYNKLPMWQRLGLAGLGIAGGVALTTGTVASAAAISTVSGLVAAKRIFGSAMAAVGTSKGLDTLHQRSIGKTADKDVEKIINEMDKVKFEGTEEENKEKRHKLMLDALNVKLENVDARLRKQKMVSLCNKFIGVSVGVFLGSGMASKAIAGAIEYFNPTETVPSISLKSYENFKEMNSSIENSIMKDYVEVAHPQDVPADASVSVESVDIHASVEPISTMESLNTSAPSETIEIKTPIETGSGQMRHDSFIRSLKDHIKLSHADSIDHPAEAAETIFHDAAKTYASEHNMSYEEAVKKLSNVKPGTTYTLTQDSYGLHMHINDENVKFVKHVAGGHHPIGGSAVPGNVELPKPSIPVELPKPSIPVGEVPSNVTIQDFQEDDLHNPQYDFNDKIASAKEHLASVDRSIGIENPNNPSVSHDWDKLNNLASERLTTVNEINRLIGEHTTFSSLTRDALKEFTADKSIVDKVKFWRELKDLSYKDAIEKPGVKKAVLSILQKYADENLLGAQALPLNNRNEKFGQWIGRIIKASIEKRANLQ